MAKRKQENPDQQSFEYLSPNTAGREARDRGMLQAEAAAKAAWLARAKAALVEIARTKREFTSEDLWQAGLDKPREPRALGPVFSNAVKAGFIVRTGRFIQSRMTSRHCAPVAIWESRLCK